MREDQSPALSPEQAKAQLRAVERAVNALVGAANAVATSRYTTWGSDVRAFVHLCRTNPVLQEVLAPVLATRVDSVAWYNDLHQRSGAIAGSADVHLPVDPTERSALLMALLGSVADGALTPYDLLAVVVGAGGSSYDERIRELNQVLLAPLARDLRTRLQERIEELSDLVPSPAPATYQHFGDGPLIANQGTIQGSTIATGHAVVHQGAAEQTAALVEVVRAWAEALHEVEAGRRQEVAQALATIEQALTSGRAELAAITAAASTVVRASPTLRERVQQLLFDTAAGVTAAAIAPYIPPVLAALGTALRAATGTP